MSLAGRTSAVLRSSVFRIRTTKHCRICSFDLHHIMSRSEAYETFPKPILSSRNGFDFHVYFMPSNPVHVKHAAELHARIRQEFPELPIYRIWDRPIGPHPTAMFEVQTMTPHQTGALFSWLVVNRGPLDVFVHPNTDDTYRDHVELATWMGNPWPLNLEILKAH